MKILEGEMDAFLDSLVKSLTEQVGKRMAEELTSLRKGLKKNFLESDAATLTLKYNVTISKKQIELFTKKHRLRINSVIILGD